MICSQKILALAKVMRTVHKLSKGELWQIHRDATDTFDLWRLAVEVLIFEMPDFMENGYGFVIWVFFVDG